MRIPSRLRLATSQADTAVNRVPQQAAAGELIDRLSPHANGVAKIATPLIVLLAFLALLAPPAAATPPAPAWAITSQYSDLAPGDSSGGGGYFITATNTGAAPTDGSPVTLTDTLPAALTAHPVEPSGGEFASEPFSCSAGPPPTCTDSIRPVPPGRTIYMWVPVDVAASPPASVTDLITVSGGGVATTSAISQTPISATPSAFGIQSFDGATSGTDGSAVTQAGSHPYELRNSFTLNSHFSEELFALVPHEDPKDLTVNLPAGLVVNPNATPVRCTESQLENGGCPDASVVGTITVVTGTLFGGTPPAPDIQPSPIYNMVPPPGAPAALGFNAVGLGIFEHVLGGVRTGGDYGLSANIKELPQRAIALGAVTTLWGNPSDSSHNALRGKCAFNPGELCPVPPTNTAFLTMPSACSGPLTTSITADSWQQPGNFVTSSFESHDSSGNPVGVGGCDRLAFTPSIRVKPEVSVADSPSGLNVDLSVPQDGLSNPNGLAEANLKRAVVTLPAGMSVNPSAADGLAACSEAQIGLHNANEPTCPDASKIGSVEATTPLLSETLKGGVYLAQQGNLQGNGSNPFGSLLAIYITAEVNGALIKLAGRVQADPVTGQLTTTFDNNPQLPFSDLKLVLFGGPRAPLATPESCGTFQTVSALSPWSAADPNNPTPAEQSISADSFQVNSGCVGGFSPSFEAGTLNPAAGASSPFSVTFSRSDQDQDLNAITVKTPPGLLGKVAAVPLCGEPQAAQGTCSPASQIGHVAVAVGAGSDPVFLPQAGKALDPVYLTGPYKGAPFGLSVVVPAEAGPFNLGTVVVRATINVDPHTAQITITSDPLPTILQGIPVKVRAVKVIVDRLGFTFNPTSCDPMTVDGTITSAHGASIGVSSHFQAVDCANLPFKPSFSVSTQGQTSKASGASLVVKVAQNPGEANIHKVNLQLPLALPSRLTTLQKACTASQFESNPAGCPEGSFVGTATAHTPLLAVPLTGPAILVSHGGAAFPDVVFVLQGEGIRIDLVGNTDIKKGITFSRFETVPDAPISSFETSLPEGPHSVLAAYGSLCSQKLVMPTTITGQNGAQVAQSTNIAATGCGKPSIKITKAKIKGNTVLVTVTTTQQGTVTVSGNGLKTIKKTLAAGAHQLKVSLTKNGRTARKHHRKTKVKASVKNSNGSSSKTMTLKL
jgi:hypothetical protein